jgi:hypothetical protein
VQECRETATQETKERKKRRKKRLFSRVVLSSLSLSLSLYCAKSIISRGPRRVECVLCFFSVANYSIPKSKGAKGYGAIAAPAPAAACKPQAVFDRSYTNEGSPVVVSRYF